MKKYYRAAALVLAIAMITVTLTSGVSKDYRGGGRDMVEELYDQAVKQNDDLQSIEEDIERFPKKRNEALEKYNGFVSYNNRYYSDAREKASTIDDAAIKQRTNDIINKSEAAYNVKTVDWQNTISFLNANEKQLNDLHILLKIKISETMIEKYQTTNFPDNAKLKEANADLLKLIEKIKAITK